MLTNFWTRNALVSTAFKHSQYFDHTGDVTGSGGGGGGSKMAQPGGSK